MEGCESRDEIYESDVTEFVFVVFKNFFFVDRDDDNCVIL